MDYKLLIILVGTAIIFHHFYQEMGSLREYVDGMKIRINKLEEIPNSHTIQNPVKSIDKHETNTELPITTDGETQLVDQEIIDKRFAQMNDIVSRLGTNFPKQNTDTDEPSFEIANGEIWQNKDNITQPHISGTSVLYNLESSRIPESYIERTEVKIGDTSETIKSYADSAVTIKCWPNEQEGKQENKQKKEYNDTASGNTLGSKKVKYTQNSDLDSETLSLDLTNNAGGFRLIPRIRTPPLKIGFAISNQRPVSPSFGKALNELGKLMRKHVELEVGSSGSSRADYLSDSSSEITGGSKSKNNIRGTVYERK